MAYVDESGLEYYSTLVKKDIDTKASIDSPALTGTPTAPTPEDSTNESQIATVGYVGSEVSNVESSVESVKSTAEKALDTANDAQSSATTAQTSAESAQTSADKAQRDATDALDTINDTRAIAEEAINTANEAMGAIDSVSGAVEAATTAAEEATTAAQSATQLVDSVQGTVDNITELVNQNTELVDQLNQDISDMKLYNSVGDVDLDDYYDDYARIFVTSGSSNIPSFAESYYIDVDVNTDMIRVRQTAIGAATGNMYVRNGSLTDEGDLPLEATSGTLVINGDVSADIYVNGNVEVNGIISGTVNATGTITYDDKTGTTNQKTDISANDCDISIDGGTLTFASGIDFDDNRVLHTDGNVANDSDADTIIYSFLNIEVDTENGLNNDGSITVKSGVIVTATTMGDDGYGIYNNGTFVVNGDLYGNAPTEEMAVYGEFSGSGHVYANSNVYYDGSEDVEPETKTYSVEWDEWVLSGTGTYLPLNGGTMNGDLNMGLGTEIVANGLTITAEGHIKLPSGVEFY